MKEFKVLVVSNNTLKYMDLNAVAELLEEKSEEGWEVVSVCPDGPLKHPEVRLLVTLQRDKQDEE